MKKITLFLLFSIFSLTTTYSQQKFEVVIIDSSIVRDTLYMSEAYYENQFGNIDFKSDLAIAINNKYVFMGSLDYPSAVRIFFKSKHKDFNELIFVQPGYQKLCIKKKNDKLVIEYPYVNAVSKDYFNYLTFFKIKEINTKVLPDSLLLYTKCHPNSYVSLYALINQTFNYGYSPHFYEIANQFSPIIKKTKAYEYYYKQYLSNIQIPKMLLLNKNGEKIVFSPKSENRQYTLLQFWFNSCPACVNEMRELKEIYNKGAIDKMEIVSISIDRKEEIYKGRTLLDELGIPWECYWDENGQEFKKIISLYKYPTNILLDYKGKIVAKDVQISDLKMYLKTEMEVNYL